MTLLHCLLTATETMSLNCPDCVPSSSRRWRLPQVGTMKSLRTERLKGAPRRSERNQRERIVRVRKAQFAGNSAMRVSIRIEGAIKTEPVGNAEAKIHAKLKDRDTARHSAKLVAIRGKSKTTLRQRIRRLDSKRPDGSGCC